MPSRNNHQKNCASPKRQKRKSPFGDVSSGDDSYAGVEQISDSEENEPNVEKEEERAIIFSEDRIISMSTPQNILDETWEGFSDIPYLGDDMSLFGQDTISDDRWCLRTEVAKRDESTEYDPAFETQSIQFESSDDEFDMFDDLFPDIFINKDHLDSSFRRQIDHDDVSDEGSYWEYDDVGDTFSIPFSNPYTLMMIPKNKEFEEYDCDSSTLTGYESDISGETTDDDLPAEYYLQHRKDAVSIPEVESDAEEEIDNSSPLHTPCLYSWEHTSDKPFATVSSNYKKMILFNVRDLKSLNPSQSSQVSSGLKMGETNLLPLNSNTKNFNISDLQNPALSSSNTLISMGLPEFYAPLAVDAGLDMTSYSSSFYDSDEFGDENFTEISPNLDEFINFEPDDSSFNSREAESSSHIDVNTTASLCSSKTNTEDQIHPLISHFNRGIVGSWRQKQNTHKLLHRNIVTPDSLGFGGNRFMEGTLKGVKSGRLRHANTPITPVRKQRPLASLDIATDIKSTTSSKARKSSNIHEEGRNSKKRKVKM